MWFLALVHTNNTEVQYDHIQIMLILIVSLKKWKKKNEWTIHSLGYIPSCIPTTFNFVSFKSNRKTFKDLFKSSLLNGNELLGMSVVYGYYSKLFIVWYFCNKNFGLLLYLMVKRKSIFPLCVGFVQKNCMKERSIFSAFHCNCYK